MAVRMTGMISGMDTESLIQSMVDAQRMKNKKVSDKSQLLEWKQEKWKDLNTKLYKLYTEDLSKLRMQGNYSAKKVTTTNDSLLSVTGSSNAVSGTSSIIIESTASAQSSASNIFDSSVTTSTKIKDIANSSSLLGFSNGDTIKITNGTKVVDFTITEESTISEYITKLKSAGLNANFDNNQKRLFISGKESGTANAFTIKNETQANEVLGSMNNVAASDAKIQYNGIPLTSSTNTISVNGLTINLKGADKNQTININVSNNTQANYDMIKKFVTNYNAILKEMNELYYADSAKGYDPLSDDEKEAMTESQIEKWEDKIKGSIFRRDNTIGSLLSSMKSAVMSTVEVDGKTYSLASFGIGTSSDYTEKGLLHIDGDSDDATVSSVADKLMKALESDPDTVAAVISGVSKKLYDDMGQKMKAIPNVRSALTFYNDKTMIDQQREYKKKIQTLESKLIDLENKYYKQFAAMESALAKLQSQTSALSGLLGTNSQ